MHVLYEFGETAFDIVRGFLQEPLLPLLALRAELSRRPGLLYLLVHRPFVGS